MAGVNEVTDTNFQAEVIESDQPVLVLALDADLPPGKLYDLASEVIKPKLEQVSQVGESNRACRTANFSTSGSSGRSMSARKSSTCRSTFIPRCHIRK